MFNYTAIMLDPIYLVQGVSVSVTLADGRSFNDIFSMIDKTAGVDTGQNVAVPTILPAACVRASELAEQGLKPRDLIDGTLTMNGFRWTVTNTKPLPTPGGERDGEYLLMLAGQEDASST